MSKKELILDVAESLFNQFGYTAVGVDMIRDEAGVSKTSMYRHFGSKTKLIEAVLARRHTRFEQEIESTVSKQDGVENQLDALLDWHFSWFDRPDFKGCMFMHALSEFKASEETVSQLAMQHKLWLKQVVQGIVADELETKSSLEIRTEMVMTFIEGLIVRREFGQEVHDKPSVRKALYLLARRV